MINKITQGTRETYIAGSIINIGDFVVQLLVPSLLIKVYLVIKFGSVIASPCVESKVP